MSDDGDETDAVDGLSVALDVMEQGDAIILRDSPVGPAGRFGCYKGSWTLVYGTDDHFTATSVSRSLVRGIIEEEYPELEITTGRDDFLWYWYIIGGYAEREMFRSYCMCGDFKCSTLMNEVVRWVEQHRYACWAHPRLQLEWNDKDMNL